MPQTSPPFAPLRATFACPALLSAAGRAGLGGARETLMGAVMVVRLASGLRLPVPLDQAVRENRAEAARAWLVALTVPARARTAFLRAFATTATGDRNAVAEAVDAVTEVTAPHLDRASRSELVRLVAGLRLDALQLAGLGERPVE
ncbi:MAG: hypothetical protein K8S21_05610 [Gemmatimonadetes bacterium]|nr:hypothetical protein [Gemmatimonadota bacterium]